MADNIFHIVSDADSFAALQAQWDPGMFEMEDGSSRSPLMVACQAGLLQHVLHMTYDWDDYLYQETCARAFQAKDAARWTVLQHAARSGNVGVLKRVLHLAKAQCLEFRKQAVLQATRLAAQYQHDAVVLELVARFGDSALGLGASKDTALHAAARSGHPRCLMVALRSRGSLKRALQIKDSLGLQPLHWALHARDAPSAVAMLAAQAPPHTPTKAKATPLTMACATGDAACIAAVVPFSHPALHDASLPAVLPLAPHGGEQGNEAQLQILGTMAHCDASALAMRQRLGLHFVPPPAGGTPWSPLAAWGSGDDPPHDPPQAPFVAPAEGSLSDRLRSLYELLSQKLKRDAWNAELACVLLAVHMVFLGMTSTGDDRPGGTEAAPLDSLHTLACVLVQRHGGGRVAALSPAAVLVATAQAWRLRRRVLLRRAQA